MKRIPLLLLMLLTAVGNLCAQTLYITLKDETLVSYDVNRIDYMEVMPEVEPGQLTGVWYAGATQSSTGVTHMTTGLEHRFLFQGTVLKWKKSTGEVIYDLDYADDLRSFKGTIREKSTKVTFYIIGKEEGMLVIKTGATTYYLFESPEKAKEAVIYAYPTRAELTDTAKVWALKGGSSYSSVTPMGSHFAKFAAATEEQKEWLANASNEPDAAYVNVGGYDRWTAKTITLYPYGSPMPADVNQHAIGNCCMCAVLASFAYLYPEWIKSIITQESSTVYLVKMFDPKGNPVDVRVTNKLLCNSGGGCAQLSGKAGKFTWATILEKALFKWESCFKCNGIGGIGTEHAAPPFTGCGESYSFSPDKLHNNEMKMMAEYSLRNGCIGIGGFNVGGLKCGELETVTGHAFTIMYSDDPEHYSWVMRNPWGNDGVTHRDGMLQIPNKREIIRTMDFRIVLPGKQMAPYLKTDFSDYKIPKYIRRPGVGPTKELLRTVYGIEDWNETYENDDDNDDDN